MTAARRCWIWRERPVSDALRLTASSVFDLLDATREAGTRELRLVEAQDQLVTPRSNFKPQRVG